MQYKLIKNGVCNTRTGQCGTKDTTDSVWLAYLDWLIGKDDEYYDIVAAYSAWVNISTYDARQAQYELDKALFDYWDGENPPIRPEEPILPIKPKGYHTQEEVDISTNEHDDWLALQAAFIPEFDEDVFAVAEPEQLLLPIELPEPLIPLDITLGTNTPDPELTEEEKYVQDLAILKATDLSMARVAEDLYEFIVNGIAIPQEAKDIIADRKVKRDKIKT